MSEGNGGEAGLRKELGMLVIFCLASGAMISSGLFILPGLAHQKAGSAVFISYLIAGIMAVFGVLPQAELASAMPKAGGTYFYVTRSMGPGVGTVYGLITVLALALKAGFELVGLSAYVALAGGIDSDIIRSLIGVAFAWGFVAINLIGVKEAGRIQIVLVFVILSLLLLFIVKGIPAMQLRKLEPFAPKGFGAVLATAGFVFISYGGLLKVASVAEEVRDPGRNLSLGMILSLAVVSIFYTLTIIVMAGTLESAVLDKSLTPIPDSAGVFLDTPGKALLGLVGVLAFCSAANAGIMSASRYPMALSRDELLPDFLGNVSRRFNTPHYSIILVGVLVSGILFLELETLVKCASAVLILTYMFACVAVIILRESGLQNYQPNFRTPLYPWLPIVGTMCFGALLFGIGKTALLISLALVLCGACVYLLYGRRRVKHEYALLHLIERITAVELTGQTLEEELKTIIRERDDIVKDRFDHIIEDSIVLDIEERITMEEFFQRVAERMSERLVVKAETIYQKLLERESQSTTVISPGLAIPHIVIDGEGRFDILLARCRGGIVFSEDQPEVHTAFVLIGTMDERNFHLRSLASLAQVVDDPEFEEKWMSAKNQQALRDTILLGKRRR